MIKGGDIRLLLYLGLNKHELQNIEVTELRKEEYNDTCI